MCWKGTPLTAWKENTSATWHFLYLLLWFRATSGCVQDLLLAVFKDHSWSCYKWNQLGCLQDKCLTTVLLLWPYPGISNKSCFFGRAEPSVISYLFYCPAKSRSQALSSRYLLPSCRGLEGKCQVLQAGILVLSVKCCCIHEDSFVLWGWSCLERQV